MEDNQIVKMIWNRDETALSALSSKYSSYCYSIAYNILNDSEDAEECVNDTWLGVWNSIPPNCPDVLKTYAGKITRNISLKRWEEKHSKKRFLLAFSRGGGIIDFENVFANVFIQCHHTRLGGSDEGFLGESGDTAAEQASHAKPPHPL